MSMMCSLGTAFFENPERFRRSVWGVLFGEEIELRREEHGLSIEEAASRAGFLPRSGRISRPARSPSPGNSSAPWPMASERSGWLWPPW